MSINNLRITPGTFEEILPFWSNELWPDRKSPIEALSYINENGEIDMGLIDSEVTFFKAVLPDNKIVGVLSIIKTSSHSWRSRGIWVDSNFRKQGIGSALLEYAINWVKLRNGHYIWSMPKVSAFSFYKKLGFDTYQEISIYENGPHYLARVFVKDK